MLRRAGALVLIAALAAACGDRLVAGTPGSSPAPVASAAPSASAIASAAATAIGATILPVTPAPSGAPTPAPVATPASTPSPTIAPAPSPALTLAQLKYRLVDRFGRLWYCDPDSYPVARADQDSLAESRFPEVQKDAETFDAIIGHLGIAPSATYPHEQKVAIYTDWKMLGALQLSPAGAAYRFTARFSPDDRTGSLVDGTIDARGVIAVASQTPSGPPPCPICLARGTRIATPAGPVSVEDLREGMAVWTSDALGRRVAGVVLLVGSTIAPAEHVVVDLTLADGREVHVSPGHPLPDGRAVGSLAVGETLDGSVIAGLDRLAYGSGRTFDLLPSGPTGLYWAGGIPLASTLRP